MTENANGRVQALFVTPVVVDELGGAEALNAALERTILARRKQSPGLKLSNRGGWQSTHDFADWSGDEGHAVVRRALDLASAHAQRGDGSAPPWKVEAWANVSGPGAFNMPHVHGGTYGAAV